jgi:hypothetical protein
MMTPHELAAPGGGETAIRRCAVRNSRSHARRRPYRHVCQLGRSETLRILLEKDDPPAFTLIRGGPLTEKNGSSFLTASRAKAIRAAIRAYVSRNTADASCSKTPRCGNCLTSTGWFTGRPWPFLSQPIFERTRNRPFQFFCLHRNRTRHAIL